MHPHGDPVISGAYMAVTESPYLSCSKGAKGRLKASKLEFEIIDTTSNTSTIKIKPWGTEVTMPDEELRKAAVGISSL